MRHVYKGRLLGEFNHSRIVVRGDHVELELLNLRGPDAPVRRESPISLQNLP
ncbi:MAG TPA: hypothetical protein VKU19_37810 [Bryobacteraceae bacterium]|nr:hypothetical protein [Bryobacteraceae bacterium]